MRENPKTAEIIKKLTNKFSMGDVSNTEEDTAASEAITVEMTEAMTKYQPLRGYLRFSGESFTEEEILEVIEELNNSEL